jgi:RNA polymerase sigma-70 factor (ECF subfamily)
MAEHALALPESEPVEAELIERARQKDGAAIRLIIKQHNRRLYRIARSIVRDDGEAEDALQEAYVRAFNNLHAFRGEARLSTWLARIVINEALACLRRRRPLMDTDPLAEGGPLSAQVISFPRPNPELDPETTIAQREIHALLEHAIDKLPEAFRGVVVARLVEGMSVEETAEVFGILPQTVKTRLFRGRSLLKREMERHIGPTLGDAFPFAGRRCDRVTKNVLARLGLT